jgi:hypothetical protein
MPAPSPVYRTPPVGARCSGTRAGNGLILGGCKNPAVIQHTLWGVLTLSCASHFEAGGGNPSVIPVGQEGRA